MHLSRSLTRVIGANLPLKNLVVIRGLCVAAVRCRIIVGALALTMVCAFAPAAADEVQRKRFLEEAPKAWAALEDYISRSRSVVHETVTLRTPDRDDGSAAEQAMHCTIETKLAGEKLVVIRQQAPDWPVSGPGTAAAGENPSYRFEVLRAEDGGPWSIERMQLVLTPRVEGRSGRAVGQPMAATGLYDIRLKHAVSGGGFELRDARTIADPTGERVEIDFRYTPQGDNRSRLRGGTAVFAPDRYWTLDKATAHIAYGDGETPMSYSFQYKIDSAGFPLLSRVEVSYDREPGSRETTVREYSTFDHIDIPDDEFLLTAFGLPEPTPVAGRVGGWRWGLIAAGVAALLIAATLRRLVRKRKQVI